MLPVVQRCVERKLLALSRGHPLPERHQVSRVEDAVDLCVDTVKLNQVEAAFQPVALFVEVVGQVGDACPERQPFDRPLRRRYKSQSRLTLRGELTTRRIRPRRRSDRLPVAVAQRVLREVLRRLLGHAAEPERVAAARGGVIDAGLGVWRRTRGNRQNRVDDEVRRDDVQERIGEARKIAKDAAAEREDQRLRHAESFQPAGEGLIERALDDRRPHDRERDVAVELDDRVLRHRLGERVDVGEAHRVGVDAPAFDEALPHPSLAEALGRAGHGRRAGRTHSRLGLTAKPLEHLWPA